MISPETLPPWRPLLRGAREREGRAPQARWLQLASVAGDGSPRVRTLVFRGWAGATALDLLSDGRSAKAAELAAQPAVELEQRERQRHWQELSPAGRAVWGWPSPGEPRDQEAAFPAEIADGSPLPAHLLLLRIHLQQVELLELQAHPHRRRRWRAETAWCEEDLNP
jgi:pyridoxamine 5'-phosphate oxidase